MHINEFKSNNFQNEAELDGCKFESNDEKIKQIKEILNVDLNKTVDMKIIKETFGKIQKLIKKSFDLDYELNQLLAQKFVEYINDYLGIIFNIMDYVEGNLTAEYLKEEENIKKDYEMKIQKLEAQDRNIITSLEKNKREYKKENIDLKEKILQMTKKMEKMELQMLQMTKKIEKMEKMEQQMTEMKKEQERQKYKIEEMKEEQKKEIEKINKEEENLKTEILNLKLKVLKQCITIIDLNKSVKSTNKINIEIISKEIMNTKNYDSYKKKIIELISKNKELEENVIKLSLENGEKNSEIVCLKSLIRIILNPK